jgi:hypothetical protein
MFSVIRAHQLKAFNFQQPTYVSEEQNGAERPVFVCLSVCRKKFFHSVQVRHRYQLCILRLLTKSQGIRCHGPKIYVH